MNRQNPALAEEAIREYQKALAVNKNDQSSYKAVASLYENLQKQDEWRKWVNDRAAADIKPEYRAEALTSLAARQNTCANEVSDTPETKKTIKKDGKDAYQFTKPANAEDFQRMKTCIEEGNKVIEQAVQLEPETVKSAGSLNPSSMTDEQLKSTLDLLKPFESARSYRASLIIQNSRLAEMEGRNEDRDRLRAEADRAKADFTALSDATKNLQNEIDKRKAEAEEAENANANANKAAKK